LWDEERTKYSMFYKAINANVGGFVLKEEGRI
jgi:hypothetical protein